MWNRLLRDAGILLVFCGAFYLMIVIVGGLENEAHSDQTEFSPVRKRADEMAAKQEWTSAVKEYEALIEQDPYNGHAWSRLAYGVRQIRRDAIVELNNLEDNQGSPQEIADAKQRIKVASDRAMEVYSHLRLFARHRAKALLRLAVIESYRDNKDQALDYLEEFVERGNHTTRGLANYYEFGEGEYNEVNVLSRVPTNQRLHTEARFWHLVTREREMGMTFGY